jgi:hypothetical protein
MRYGMRKPNQNDKTFCCSNGEDIMQRKRPRILGPNNNNNNNNDEGWQGGDDDNDSGGAFNHRQKSPLLSLPLLSFLSTSALNMNLPSPPPPPPPTTTASISATRWFIPPAEDATTTASISATRWFIPPAEIGKTSDGKTIRIALKDGWNVLETGTVL